MIINHIPIKTKASAMLDWLSADDNKKCKQRTDYLNKRIIIIKTVNLIKITCY